MRRRSWRDPLNCPGKVGGFDLTLIEGAADDEANARLQDAEFLRAFRDVETLPTEDKAVIKSLLDAFLTRRQLEQLVAK